MTTSQSTEGLALGALCRIWREVMGDAPSTYEGQLLAGYLQTLNGALEKFEQLSFPSGFGFDAFKQADIASFLTQPDQWNLAFHKAKGKGILYGRRHVRLRQELVNALPTALRKALLFQKLHPVTPFLSLQLSDVSDIVDIGMGHSVYRIQYTDSSQSSQDKVIKQEELLSQAFITQVLSCLGWPSYRSGHWVNRQGAWEISDYISGKNLQDQLTAEGVTVSLLEELGRQAALGDCLGRGDRHPENYMVKEGRLYPIDISYLFWEDNEQWLDLYIRGGMAEYSICALAGPDEELPWKSTFWQAYHAAYRSIQDAAPELMALIKSYYGEKDPETTRKCQFLSKRLQDPGYETQQKTRYEVALKQLIQRAPYKHKLDRLLRMSPEKVKQDPWVYMYALANEDRLASFYQADAFLPDLYARIDKL